MDLTVLDVRVLNEKFPFGVRNWIRNIFDCDGIPLSLLLVIDFEPVV